MIQGKRVFTRKKGKKGGYLNRSGSKGLSKDSVSPLIIVLASSLPTAGTMVFFIWCLVTDPGPLPDDVQVTQNGHDRDHLVSEPTQEL